MLSHLGATTYRFTDTYTERYIDKKMIIINVNKRYPG
jgi:hypothetical protein